MNEIRRLAVVVAGGKGLRMGAELPKQFIPIGGKPVLMHTLERFATCDTLVLVLPEEHHGYWAELCAKYHCTIPHEVVRGGETRYHSVYAGLSYLEGLGLKTGAVVAVHDGVRPFVSEALIAACYAEAEKSGAALPYLPVVDSLRKYQGDTISLAVPRNEYCTVQTPQVFDLERLLSAYRLGYQDSFTDDASVWEYAGYASPSLVLGERTNIKITHPEDLLWAEYLIQNSR